MQIEYDSKTQAWVLDWSGVRLQLHLTRGSLVSDYFGPAQRPPTPAITSPFGDPLLDTRVEGRVELAPGNRAPTWALHDWSQPDAHTFMLTLDALHDPLQAECGFTVHPETGLLRRKTVLRHTGGGDALDIRSATSFAAMLPADVQELVCLSGIWARETQTRRTPVSYAPFLLESRAGKTGFEFAPYVALLAPDLTWVFEVCWSGNWQMHVHRQFDDRVAVCGGLNDWGLRHRLRPGESLELPDALMLCVPGNLNAATQRLHDYQRDVTRPDPHRPIPVQFNTWFQHLDTFTLDDLKRSAQDAAQLGCEVVVIDAGWFGLEDAPDAKWWVSVGDWVVKRSLSPDSLKTFGDFCRAQGLGLGIWFEPESASPQSVVQRNHPEWLHTLGGKLLPSGHVEASSRAVLNLGIPEARVFVRERILSILRATGATWMKWDFNMNLLQGGWAAGLPEDLVHQDPLIAHVNGVYQLQNEIRAALPGLTLEMCAGGGGRFDPQIMSRAHVHWMSDEVQPLCCLAMHFGSQLAHPALECNSWLVNWPTGEGKTPQESPADQRCDLAFRTRVAMLGAFGISAPVDRWTPEDIALVQTHVHWYKTFVRPLVHAGDQYILTDAPPFDGNGDWAAVWYAAKDGRTGALFAFRLAGREASRSFALPGLHPDTTYRVFTPEGSMTSHTGAELASGLTVNANQPFRSALILVEQAH